MKMGSASSSTGIRRARANGRASRPSRMLRAQPARRDARHKAGHDDREVARLQNGRSPTIAAEESDGRQDEPLSGSLCALAARSAGILGRGGRRHRLDREAEDGVRSERRRLWPLVSRWRLQHLLQRGRPPRRGRPRHAARDHLRLAGHRHRSRPSPTPRCRPRPRRWPASSSTTSASRRATASSSTCRWCRRRWSACWPARGSARCIRWCSAASRRRSSPPASTTPSRRSFCPRAAASRRRASFAYKPLLDAAIDLAKHKPDACMILQRPQLTCELTPGRDHDWQETWDKALVWAWNAARAGAGQGHRSALHPLHLGHDRHPEGRRARQRRPHGRAAMVDADISTASIPARPGGAAPTSAGWSATATSSMRRCCTAATSILYEGKPVGTPDAGAYWRVISEYGAVAFFTAPTAFRAIKKEDPEGKHFSKYDLSKFRTLFLAGERADPDTMQWAERLLKKPVIDHWWQTETGWCIAGNPVGLGQLPVKHGSPTVAMPGYDVRAVDDGNKELPRGTMGSLVIKLPLPPSCLPTLVAAGRAHARELPRRVSRLLQDRRRRLRRRGRLRLCDGPHRRHHQRRRPPAFDRRHGGGAVGAPGRRRMRRARHQG